MGDILHALPAVTALREAHPSWVIDWVVEPRWRALLSAPGAQGRGAGRPVVDRLHFAATKLWRKAPFSSETLQGLRLLRHDMRSVGYDTVLDLQGAIRSSLLARMTGCRRRIGEAVPREKAARWMFNEKVPTTGTHIIEQDIELAMAIAADELEHTLPQLPVDPASEAWADQILSDGQGPVVLLNPGAGWGAKRWPIERYADQDQDLDLVIAGPDQADMQLRIKHLAGRMGVLSRVHFPGMIRGAAKWGALQAAEALALPSHQENFGIAVVEALAVGKPVLISNQVNIWPDIKQDHVGLVEEDTSDGTRRLLRRWVEMSAIERARLTSGARASFQRRYAMNRAAEAINDIFSPYEITKSKQENQPESRVISLHS